MQSRNSSPAESAASAITEQHINELTMQHALRKQIAKVRKNIGVTECPDSSAGNMFLVYAAPINTRITSHDASAMDESECCHDPTRPVCKMDLPG